MRVPMKWLKDIIPTKLGPKELAERLTMAGLEAEKIEEVPEGWENVFVGYVEHVEKHPNADRLFLADVNAGEHKLRVVTGAPNIAEGEKVALALAGARLIDPYSESPTPVYKTLKPGKIRGIVSEGMVCSERELGISDEHEGILVLPDDAPVGVPLKEYLGDTVIEFEITPNLVHAFSMIGIAKQVAALTGEAVHEPTVVNLAALPPADDLVAIADPDLCLRFTGAVVEGVRVGPSPEWMQSRLNNAGVRPINNMVDITNYVMLEYGQPLHAYDRRRLAGGHLVARRAKPGEKVETIDHVVRGLTTDMLVIADDSGAVGVAGVMGGVASEVSDDTTTILLESANFEMRSIRHTRQALKLRTEASARFERGLDPNLASKAAARALSLMLELCPGATVIAWQDVYPNPVQPRHLTMPFNTIERVLGIGYPEEQVVEVLSRLELQPVLTGPDGNRTLAVTIPTERQDLSIPEDVVEEVARIIGYDTLPETLIKGRTPEVSRDPVAEFEADLRHHLAASGAWECVTYTLVSEGLLRGLTGPQAQEDGVVGILRPKLLAELIRVVNPLQADRPYLRTTLVPSLLEVAAENRKHEPGVRLFEIAPIYVPNGRDELPTELPTLAMVYTGQRGRRDRFGQLGELDYFDLKGTIDAILARLGVASDATFMHSERIPGGFHPGRSAEIAIKNRWIGVLGELRPDVAAQYGLENGRVVAAELDLQALQAVLPPRLRQVSVSHYLPVEQDFAIVVDEDIPAADVERALFAGAGPLAKQAVLFDIFRGPQLGEGKKSLAYRVTFEAPDRALTDAELVKTRNRIEKVLKKSVGGVLRG